MDDMALRALSGGSVLSALVSDSPCAVARGYLGDYSSQRGERGDFAAGQASGH